MRTDFFNLFIKQQSEILIRAFEERLETMSDEEFVQLPLIDEETKRVAEKYGLCMAIHRNKDYTGYYRVYVIFTYIFREPLKIKLTSTNKRK